MAGLAASEFKVADLAPAPEEHPAAPGEHTPEAAGDEHTTGTEADGHAPKPGLPQLDTTTFASQLFWLFISLAVLYVVLSRVALPKIQGVLGDRANRIKGDLDAAAQAKRDSEAAIAGYEKALADARAKALKSSDELRNQVQSEVNAKNDAAARQLAADTAKAEARIAEMRRQALSNVGAVARDTANDIVTKLTGETANAADIAAAVERALKPA